MRKAEPRTLFARGALRLFRRSFERFMFWRRTNSPLRLSTKDGRRTTFTEWPLGTIKSRLTSAVSVLPIETLRQASKSAAAESRASAAFKAAIEAEGWLEN